MFGLLTKRISCDWKFIADAGMTKLQLSHIGASAKIGSMRRAPASISELSIEHGLGVKGIRDFAPSLQRIEINRCPKLKRVPTLPNSLEILVLSETAIERLPDLPEGLRELVIEDCPLTLLPRLPSTLELLVIENNNLKSLPDLPAGLKALSVTRLPELVELPELPEHLIRLCLEDLPRLQSKPKISERIDSLSIQRCAQLEDERWVNLFSA